MVGHCWISSNLVPRPTVSGLCGHPARTVGAMMPLRPGAPNSELLRRY